MASINQQMFSLFILATLSCSMVQAKENQAITEGYFEHSIMGLYVSESRKLTLDGGYHYVIEKERLTDVSSILGPTFSAAVSLNSLSASVGFGKISTVQMFGAHGAQIDYTYLRIWDEHEGEAFTDYSGLEFKCSFIIFSAKASLMYSEANHGFRNYLSIGIGF